MDINVEAEPGLVATAFAMAKRLGFVSAGNVATVIDMQIPRPGCCHTFCMKDSHAQLSEEVRELFET